MWLPLAVLRWLLFLFCPELLIVIGKRISRYKLFCHYWNADVPVNKYITDEMTNNKAAWSAKDLELD